MKKVGRGRASSVFTSSVNLLAMHSLQSAVLYVIR